MSRRVTFRLANRNGSSRSSCARSHCRRFVRLVQRSTFGQSDGRCVERRARSRSERRAFHADSIHWKTTRSGFYSKTQQKIQFVLVSFSLVCFLWFCFRHDSTRSNGFIDLQTDRISNSVGRSSISHEYR